MNRLLSRSSASRYWKLAGLAIVVVAAAYLAFIAPVPIPDTHSPTGASSVAEVTDWAAAGHTFRTDRDGLSRIDVALSSLKPQEELDIEFYIREYEPTGPNLRVLKKKLTDLPAGKVMELYNRRWEELPWVTFEFEPLYGYEGRQLYFNIEGKDIPRENTVQVLIAYPNGYRKGEAYLSEKPSQGNLVFRTFTAGTTTQLLDSTFPLLAKDRPGILGQEWLYRGLFSGVVLAIVVLFVSIARLGPSGRSR